MTETVSLPKAMWRGFTMKCPNCGRGHLFGRFLKVADHCEVCSEDFTPQRADDFPAYLVILIVGHVLVPLVLWVEVAYAPSLATHLAMWIPLTLMMTLGLLQPVKGTIVALQWHAGMHGFADARKARAATS
jgi:uncharacterized protein (DUF983 family)